MTAGTWAARRERRQRASFATYAEHEPLLAWRYWLVVMTTDRPRLASVLDNGAHPLPLGTAQTARCRFGHPLVPCGPDDGYKSIDTCFCGIFARPVPHIAALEHRDRRGTLRASGIGAFWGRVVQYRNVVKAEYARPVELELRGPEPPVDEAELLARDYGIRVRAVADTERFDPSRFELYGSDRIGV